MSAIQDRVVIHVASAKVHNSKAHSHASNSLKENNKGIATHVGDKVTIGN